MIDPDSLTQHIAWAKQTMSVLKVSSIRRSLCPAHPRSFFPFSTLPWYSPPPTSSASPVHQNDPFLLTISEAIKNSDSKLPTSSLKHLIPSLKPHHINGLITINPLSLSPISLLNFFNWVSSLPAFRLTIQSYCTMAHFLCTHKLFPEAESLLRFVISRKVSWLVNTPGGLLCILENGGMKVSITLSLMQFMGLGYLNLQVKCENCG